MRRLALRNPEKELTFFGALGFPHYVPLRCLHCKVFDLVNNHHSLDIVPEPSSVNRQSETTPMELFEPCFALILF